ncbi:MAG: hypothetical protein AAB391_02950 [Patescibacteria group bacterium]|mgnify:CR=1 FL=1
MEAPHPGIIDLEAVKKANDEKRASASLSAQNAMNAAASAPSSPRPSGNAFNPIRTFQQDAARAQGKPYEAISRAKNPLEQHILSEPREVTGLEQFAPVRPTINPYAGANREVIEQAVYRRIDSTVEAPAVEAIPEPVIVIPEKEKTASPLIRSIHTYKEDIASSVKGGASIASIAAAENARRTSQPSGDSETGETSKNVVIIAISISLLLIGGIGSWYVYSTYREKKQVVIEQKQRDPVQAEKITELAPKTGPNALAVQLYSSVQNSNAPLNSIERLVPISKETLTLADGSEKTIPLSTEQFFRQINANLPETLLRSLDPSFYFGLNAVHGNQPFLILKTNSFDVALSGMFRWEPMMIRDLQSIFLRPSDRVSPPLYTIGTSSISYKFEDAILQNKEIRAVRDSKGNVVLLYTFLDTKTVIITSDEATLKDMTARLIKAQFVR